MQTVIFFKEEICLNRNYSSRYITRMKTLVSELVENVNVVPRELIDLFIHEALILFQFFNY